MPVLEKISIADFRNIEFQELVFSPNINCISGNNGEGKTNLLDAIYYLSMTKSAFSASDRFNFRYGTESFAICGNYRMDNGLSTKVAIQVTGDGKKIKRDDKPYGKLSEHIGQFPVVVVSPADTALVSESGEERRRFVNAVLSQMDQEYLAAIQQYNRLLLQRNKMLKDMSYQEDFMQVIDMKLSSYAQPVYEARKAFVEKLVPVVSKYYSLLSGGKEEVSISYESDLSKGSLESILASRVEKDRMFKYTTAGIQRDDFVFMMNGYPIRKCGSQGQQKSFLVALKFAQYDIMKESCGHAPTLLLDDVFDKLDLSRISNLLSMVSSNDFGQIFITDCDNVRLRRIVDSLTADRACFETEKGSFTKV